MPEEILLIVENGTISVLGDTAKARELFGSQIGTVQQRRASHVEPISPALRIAFRVLRWLGGETGRLAAFTRCWPCQWQADMAPTYKNQNRVLPACQSEYILGPFNNRTEAINAEINWLAERM